MSSLPVVGGELPRREGFMERLCLCLSTCVDEGFFLICSVCRSCLSSFWVSFHMENFPYVAIDLICPRLEVSSRPSYVAILNQNHMFLYPSTQLQQSPPHDQNPFSCISTCSLPNYFRENLTYVYTLITRKKM